VLHNRIEKHYFYSSQTPSYNDCNNETLAHFLQASILYTCNTVVYDQLRTTSTCDSMGSNSIDWQRHSSIYKNAVGKTEITVPPLNKIGRHQHSMEEHGLYTSGIDSKAVYYM
jgi:hypothetical protein